MHCYWGWPKNIENLWSLSFRKTNQYRRGFENLARNGFIHVNLPLLELEKVDGFFKKFGQLRYFKLPFWILLMEMHVFHGFFYFITWSKVCNWKGYLLERSTKISFSFLRPQDGQSRSLLIYFRSGDIDESAFGSAIKLGRLLDNKTQHIRACWKLFLNY